LIDCKVVAKYVDHVLPANWKHADWIDSEGKVHKSIGNNYLSATSQEYTGRRKNKKRDKSQPLPKKDDSTTEKSELNECSLRLQALWKCIESDKTRLKDLLSRFENSNSKDQILFQINHIHSF